MVDGGRCEMEEREEGGGGWEVLSPSQGCGEEEKEEEEEEEEVYAEGSLTIEQGHSFNREEFPDGCLTFEESRVEQGYSFQNKHEEEEEEDEEEEEEEDGRQEGGFVENLVVLNPKAAAKASPAACVLSTMPGPVSFPGYEPHFGTDMDVEVEISPSSAAEADAPVETEEDDEKAYLDRSRSGASLGSPYEAYLGGWGIASSSSCAGGKRIGGARPTVRTSGDDLMIDTRTPRMYMASPPSSTGSAGYRRKRDMARLGITPPRGGEEGGGVLFFE